MLQGTIIGHRNGIAMDFGPSVGWPEDRNAVHWLENRVTVPAVEISFDIVRCMAEVGELVEPSLGQLGIAQSLGPLLESTNVNFSYLLDRIAGVCRRWTLSLCPEQRPLRRQFQ